MVYPSGNLLNGSFLSSLYRVLGPPTPAFMAGLEAIHVPQFSAARTKTAVPVQFAEIFFFYFPTKIQRLVKVEQGPGRAFAQREGEEADTKDAQGRENSLKKGNKNH